MMYQTISDRLCNVLQPDSFCGSNNWGGFRHTTASVITLLKLIEADGLMAGSGLQQDRKQN
jgi:hypothetical protein